LQIWQTKQASQIFLNVIDTGVQPAGGEVSQALNILAIAPDYIDVPRHSHIRLSGVFISHFGGLRTSLKTMVYTLSKTLGDSYEY